MIMASKDPKEHLVWGVCMKYIWLRSQEKLPPSNREYERLRPGCVSAA